MLLNIFLYSLFSFTQPSLVDLQPKGSCNQVVSHNYYSFCYSEKHRQALWTTHILTLENVHGKIKRTNDFKSDPHIEFPVDPTDYFGSGFDRGHLVPAADMKISKQSMSSSFYMTNISPQNPKFNRGIWRALESKIRQWTHDLGTAYIITAPVLKNNLDILDVGVSVPKQFYKIVYFPESQVMKAYLIPNEAIFNQPLDDFSISVDELESITNFDFFSYLPDKLENKLEGKR